MIRNSFLKKILMISTGLILSGLMIATVNAGPYDETGTRQTEGLRTAQSGTSVQPAPGSLSKRNKAMIEQSKAAKKRRDALQSGASGTTPNKASMSRRAKAKKEVADQAKKKQDLMRSENSTMATKTR